MIDKLYHWFWNDLMQRDEPYTKQASRIAEAHPTFFYGSIGTFVLLCLVGLTFAGWFIYHILDYIKGHPENKPLE
jgi:hypothetical protein